MSNEATFPSATPGSPAISLVGGVSNAGSSAAPAAQPGAEMLQLSWSQPPGLVGLSFKNFLLRIVTLGIYQFWGKTEVRKRIWSGTRINGEPLQYTGTGGELFKGFLLIMAVVFVPVFIGSFAVALVFGPESSALGVFQLVLYIAFFFLIGVGLHRAVRYRMSRTTWRGIRGGLEGSAWSYGWTYFWTGIMLILTLGWASPWRATKLQGLITNGMRFGDRPFRFAASSGPLYGPFLALWLSGIAIMMTIGLIGWQVMKSMPGGIEVFAPGQKVDPAVLFRFILIVYGLLILGFLLFAVVSAWYRAQLMNHFADHTSFEDARFHGYATGRSLIWLAVSNMAIVLFTLGLLSPVAQARSARYFVERLRLDGSAKLAEILQRVQDNAGRGEGLAQAFDIDAF